jgi:branched-chain amino acid transport system permease protein
VLDFLTSEYAVHMYTLVGIYLILCQGYTVVFGLGRLFNLAHIASYALGAYTTTLLMMDAQWGVFPALLGAVVVSSFFAVLIGALSVRLASDYFAIGTLAFSSVVSAILINWREVTRGVLGIPGIERPVLLGFTFDSNLRFLALVWLVCLIVCLSAYCLIRGSYGRALRGVGEFTPAALSIGLNVAGLRLFSLVFASVAAAVAGALFSFYISFIDPSSFSLADMILVLTIVVVGRPGSFWGTVGATVGMLLVPEALRFVEIPSSILGPARQLLYAALLFLFVWFNRARLFPQERKV